MTCKSFSRNKVKSSQVAFSEMSKDERISKTLHDREEFIEKLNKYKFYKASDFFEDNIGHIEVATADAEIINTSF